MKQMMAIAVTALAIAAPAAAQQMGGTIGATGRADVEKLMEKMQVELARSPLETRITKGAPYSAEAITETTQLFADGNRIARKSVVRVYRDSEGRTRRETLSASGDVVSVNISDPVGQSMYQLDPAHKIAYRNGVIMTSPAGAVAVGTIQGTSTLVASRTPDGSPAVVAGELAKVAEVKAGVEIKAARAAGEHAAGTTLVTPLAFGARSGGPGSQAQKEDLGQQVIEGVLATGTRSTTVIPAGSIGNVKPIQVVAEQWYSEDLKLLVMTKHSDPRSGETSYRLNNVVQGEPARSLFEVPADYTLQDSVIRRKSPLQQ